MKRPAGKAASAKTMFKINTSTRPQSHFTKKDLILVALPNLPVWPRLRKALGVTLFVHLMLLLALPFWSKRETSILEEITEVKFEDESELPRPRQTQRRVAPKALLKEEPRPTLQADKNFQNEKGGSGQRNDERGSQQELSTRMSETNPNAGGSSLSDNNALDIPGKIGALNPSRPPARGVGKRSLGSVQINISAGSTREYEASDLAEDFASNAVAATSAFRNRNIAPGNGLGKSNFGAGVDLGKGTGAGMSEGEDEGSLYGAQGDGANLGGSGYGLRAGRGAGNGVGEGIGNGAQIGIAAGLADEEGAMSMNEVISWMKSHPGALPQFRRGK